MTRRLLNGDKPRAEPGALRPSAQPPARGLSVRPPVRSGIQVPPALSTHHPWHWAGLLNPCRLYPFWKSLVTTPHHHHTHTQTSGSKAFLKQPGGLGSSFSSPFYTTQHSPAVGTEPQTRILVTICFPENRILVHFTSWSFKLKAGRGTAWPTWRSVENRNPLGVTSVFLPKTGLWDNSGILQSICTFQVRVPFS